MCVDWLCCLGAKVDIRLDRQGRGEGEVLGIICARPASLQLAVFALKNKPMWAGVTHSAVPE